MSQDENSEQDETVTLKIMEPAEEASAHEKTNKRKSKPSQKPKKQQAANLNVKARTQNKVLFLGIALCVVAVILFAATLIVHFMGSTSTETLKRPYISEALELFESADLHSPNFEKYAYIDTEGLDNPTISDVTLGDVYYGGDESSEAYCDARATVVYRNSYVAATSNLKMKLAYDSSDKKWHDDGVVVESQTVEPTGSANIDALKSSIIAQLGTREGEAGLAARMSDASIEVKSALSKNGGSIELVLTKEEVTEENQDVDSQSVSSSSSTSESNTSASEGATTATTVTSSQTIPALVTTTTKLVLTVSETLNWQSGEGWVAQITDVGDLKETIMSKTVTALASLTTDASQTPTKQLVCSAGDIVQISGSVSVSEGKIILDAGELIKVEISGNSVNTRYFELLSLTETLTSGQTYTVQGKINSTGNSQYPVSVTLS